MQLFGWGCYPKLDVAVTTPHSKSDFLDCLQNIQSIRSSDFSNTLVARGLGRSYGDSALGKNVLQTSSLNHFSYFDETTGLLKCEAGVTLAQILDLFVPRGWFLPVTPGTKFVTVGGAIASDIHGKNHHINGTFCEHLTQIEILLGNGKIVTASPIQNQDLFHATCGGMGLTGILLSATIRLIPIKSSNIIQTTIRAPNLSSALEALEGHQSSSYTVAWIDCLAKGKNLGRSLLMLGEHAQHGPVIAHPKNMISIPINMPNFFSNKFSVAIFNALYYRKEIFSKSIKKVSYDSFFFPLDALGNWNRLYGKSGFIQYQFVIPKIAGENGLREILERIANSGRGSYLAVLKIFGKKNKNLLSFPIEGYTLALDFKIEASLFKLLNELDELVLKHGGRLYLTKDARMSEYVFKKSYDRWSEFETIRKQYDALGIFSSSQSKRLGLQ